MTTNLTKLSIVTLVLALGIGFVLANSSLVSATSYTDPGDLEAGDLIRGESFSAVYYYGSDGFRYVFPNDKAYFTWYDDFSDIKWLTDSNMSKVQIGGNVTYKPGVKMIKITSDPKVYVIESGGVIRSIPSEEVAIDLYGSSWNTMIDDVPDGFFPNYTMGSALEFASQYSASAEEGSAWSIDVDKSLEDYTTVVLDDSGIEDVTIDAGTVIRFINEGTDKHGATDDDGDWGTGTLNTGDHFSRYFEDQGIYGYHDKYDDSETGTITVQ
jgi:plastocyanin